MPAPKGNSGIYKITSPKGRIYIGQTLNFVTRFNKYKNGKCKGQIRLYNSFLKYGTDNHIFEIIEICSENEMNNRERYYQEKYSVLGKRGLNCKLTGSETLKGRHSDKTKQKISIAHKGKKISEQSKLKMSIARLGKKMPEKQRDAMVGRKLKASTVSKMCERMKGNKFTLGVVPANARKVVDGISGRIFLSTMSAAKYLGIKQRTLTSWLNGQSPNKSSMEFI